MGLPVEAAREVHRAAHVQDGGRRRDWKLSREYGITGVPTFVVGRYGVVGAQPYEALAQLVEKGLREEEAEG